MPRSENGSKLRQNRSIYNPKDHDAGERCEASSPIWFGKESKWIKSYLIVTRYGFSKDGTATKFYADQRVTSPICQLINNWVVGAGNCLRSQTLETYFAGGFQFWRSVMGEGTSSRTVLIRKRPSRATWYCRPMPY